MENIQYTCTPHSLYWRSFPFDMVSGMYTKTLKPLIFDQNELEHHSTPRIKSLIQCMYSVHVHVYVAACMLTYSEGAAWILPSDWLSSVETEPRLTGSCLEVPEGA